MISWARELLSRPIAAGEQSRLFAVAVAVLVLTATVLLAFGRGDGSPTDEAAAPGNPPPAATTQDPAEPRKVPPAAERAARRFLPGYLSFLSGRAQVSAIASASPGLRREIARTRPRVPPASRRRRPRVVALDAELLQSGAVAVTAQISDGGVSRYPVTLRLRARSGSWAVVEVGGD